MQTRPASPCPARARAAGAHRRDPEENEEYGEIIGSSSTPYLNGLARRSALAMRVFAIRHPSLPNYLALTGGSTFGISSDCTGCRLASTSIVDQLQGAHISRNAYMEDLPHPCFAGPEAG